MTAEELGLTAEEYAVCCQEAATSLVVAFDAVYEAWQLMPPNEGSTKVRNLLTDIEIEAARALGFEPASEGLQRLRLSPGGR